MRPGIVIKYACLCSNGCYLTVRSDLFTEIVVLIPIFSDTRKFVGDGCHRNLVLNGNSFQTKRGEGIFCEWRDQKEVKQRRVCSRKQRC